MNEILEYWEKLKAQSKELIQRIEESALFEQLVLKFESLEPRQQKAWKLAGIYASLLLIASIFLIPIWGVISQKSKLGEQRKLLAELQTFNSENSVIRKPAPRPQGWTGLPASNVNEMESALSQYAESMGIPADFIVSSVSGSSIDMELKELSLRQALTLIFQIDGYYPGMEFESLKVNVHPQAKDLLEMRLRARVDPTRIAGLSGQGGGGGGGGSRSRGSSQYNGDSGGAGTQGYDGDDLPNPQGPGRNNYDDDFGGDAGTPPLNFEDDL